MSSGFTLETFLHDFLFNCCNLFCLKEPFSENELRIVNEKSNLDFFFLLFEMFQTYHILIKVQALRY